MMNVINILVHWRIIKNEAAKILNIISNTSMAGGYKKRSGS